MNCPVASLHISSYLVERRHRPSTEHILRAAAHHTTRALRATELRYHWPPASRRTARRRRLGPRTEAPVLGAGAPCQGYRRRSEGDTLFSVLLAGSGLARGRRWSPSPTIWGGRYFIYRPSPGQLRAVQSASCRHLMPMRCVSALSSSAALLRRLRPSPPPIAPSAKALL